MTVVIKRNRRREQFDADKLRRSVDLAAAEAGLSPAKRKSLAGKVAKAVLAIANKQAQVRSAMLREWILYRLDKLAPAVSRSWRDHDRETKGLT